MKILLMISVLSAVAFGQQGSVREKQDEMWLKYDLRSTIYADRPVRSLCSVPVAKSPNVRGKFRLGMIEPTKPTIALADGTPIGAVKDSEVSTAATYFEGKLIRLKAVYRNDITWDSAAEFAFVIASEFDLPTAAWRDNSPLGLVMFCDGWTILAESNRVDIRDEAALARKAKADLAAKSAAAEEKKKTFKP